MLERTLLTILAHPDDETLVGGTLAGYAAQGGRVFLLTATHGEAGTIFNPALATRATIAQVREEELRCACTTLGINEPRFLTCGDGAVRGCADVAVAEAVAIIRELRPQVVLTFGPDGVYGHPDHVSVHQIATEAWHRAGDSRAFPEHFAAGLKAYSPARLFYAELTRSMVDAWRHYTDLTIELNGQSLPITGVPDDEISISVDVSERLAQKMQAFTCHATQISPDSPMKALPHDDLVRIMGREHFVLAAGSKLPAGGTGTDLFEGLDV